MFRLKADLHRFPTGVFGSAGDLIRPTDVRERDTLMIACSELGTAPDNVSFAKPGRFVILQHIGASVPSKVECDNHEELAFDDVEALFDKCDFRHVIVCGRLDSGVIRYWLQPMNDGDTDVGKFRLRFDNGTRHLVDSNYSPDSVTDRCTLMICEHVLCQIENLLTHPFIVKRAFAKQISFHGWIIDDKTARVFAYSFEESAYVPI